MAKVTTGGVRHNPAELGESQASNPNLGRLRTPASANAASLGRARTDWVPANAASLGRAWASELSRSYRLSEA